MTTTGSTNDIKELKDKIVEGNETMISIPWPEEYDVSFDCGFVFPNPLKTLPPYFSVWNDLATNMPELIKTDTVRQFINRMPELDHTKLEGSKEKWLAYVILSTVTGIYVWIERDEGVAKVLPRQLSVPLCGICEELQMPPIGTFASIITANWMYLDPNGNMDGIIRLYPTECFQGFLNVHLMVERLYGKALPHILNALDAVRKCDTPMLTSSLQIIANAIKEMIEELNQMHIQCDAWDLFYHIRHLLAGWYYDNCPLPDGLIYEGAFNDQPRKYMGGSGAQSSTFQSLDIILGVEHDSSKVELIKKMREHMPPKHADFLHQLSKAPSIREYVKNSDNEELKSVFNEALTSLAGYRTGHMQVVAKYISIQKNRKDPQERQYSDDKGIWSDKPDIYKLLKDMRDDVHKDKL